MRFGCLAILCMLAAGCGSSPRAIEARDGAASESGTFDSSSRSGLGVATLVLDDADGSVARAMSGLVRADAIIGAGSAAAFEAAGFRVLIAPPAEFAVLTADLSRRAPDGVRWIDPTGAWSLLVRGRASGSDRLGLVSRVWLGPGDDGRAGVRVEVRPVLSDPGRIRGGFEPIDGPRGDWWLDDGVSLVVVPAGPSERFVAATDEDELFAPRATYEGTLGEDMLAGHAGGEVVARVMLVLQASSPERLRLAAGSGSARDGGGR